MTEYNKPLPVPDQYTQGYWDAARRHELVMQWCPHCGIYMFPPDPMCPNCNSFDREWKRVSGRGSVYSWFVVHYATHPDFAGDVPYAVALVQLDEQEDLRIPGNIVGCRPEDIQAGMRVEVVFDDVTPEFTLPRWKPAAR